MRDTADLARAMARETAELVPHTNAEEILRGGRRRVHHRTVAAAAAATVVAVAVPIGFLSTGGGQNGGLPAGGPGTAEVSPSVVVEHTKPAGPLPDVTLRTPRPATTPDSSVGCPEDPKNARAIGDTIWTGVENSRGEEVLARFVEKEPGNTGAVAFAVGLGDRAAGRVDNLGCLYVFDLPAVPASYPTVSTEHDGPDFYEPDGTTTIISSYVGPVDRITATYDGKPLTVKWARWSVHPDVFVYWVIGVPAGAGTNLRDIDHPRVTIYDAAGKVIVRPTW